MSKRLVRDHDGRIRLGSGPIRLLITAGLLLIVAIGVSIAALVYELRDRVLSDRERELANFTLVLAEQADQTFHAVELVQDSLIEHLRTIGISSREDFESKMSGHDLHLRLRDKVSGLLHVAAVTLINAEGKLINFSRYWPIPPVDVSDRDYFNALKSDPNLNSFLSMPVQNRGTGTWTIFFARKVSARNGEFVGLVLIAMELRYFEEFFGTINLAPTSSIALFRRDGMLLTRYPRVDDLIGTRFGADAMFMKLVERSGHGVGHQVGVIDGESRIIAAHTAAHYPIIATATRTVDEALSGWKRQAQYLIGAGILACLVTGAVIYLIAIRLLRRQKHTEQTLRENALHLGMALDNMSRGLSMFDSEGRLVICNRQYLEMYGLQPEQATPGTTLTRLLQRWSANGTFTESEPEKFSADLQAEIALGRTVKTLTSSADGRLFSIVTQPMTGGGWVSTHDDITEARKAEDAVAKARAEAERAEREARAAHARLLEAFDVVPEGLALFDHEDRFVLWNRRYMELYPESAQDVQVGARFGDVLGAGIAMGQYPEAAGREEEWLSERLARHAEKQSTHEQRLPGNRWIRIDERRTADGGSIGVRVDITDLKTREESFRLLFESNPVPMWVYDRETLRFLAVNDAAAEHYGYAREQFLSMSLLDIRPREDWPDLHAAVRQKNLAPERTWRHLKANGTLIDVSVYSRTLLYQGRSASLIAALDVTDRKRAEDERQSARDFLHTVIENVPVPITVKDANDFTYVLMNGAAEKFFGISRAEVIGKTAYDIYPKDTADTISEHDKSIMATRRQHFYEEHTVSTPGNGKRFAAVTCHPILDSRERPQHLLTVIEDVTESKAINQQLQQAQKMEAVGNLTGGLAHDFNNLLAIIIGNLDLIQEEIVGNSVVEHKIDAVLQASLRGAELTQRLLAFSRRQPLQPRCVEVSGLVRKTTQLLARTLGENITMELEIARDLWPVLVDAAQMETALINIAVNARDASPNGGKLIIGCRNTHLDTDYAARHTEVRTGDYVLIEISDMGTGMSPEVLQRVFEPFFTTKDSGKGTGLGLSMVYGFIKQSSGHISAYSEIEKGTTFRLYLPRAAESDVAVLSDGEAPELVPAAGGEVILAVDDNPGVRATVVDQLTGMGYQVLEADSAATALATLNSAIEIDLLFTDVVMPGGMSGRELAVEARATRPNLKVLFTSGFPGTLLSNDPDLDVGGTLLSKPYRKFELATAVRKSLQGA
jgi:PAS domain S-box-containing protein